MNTKYQDSINEAQSLLQAAVDPGHGFGHAARVADNTWRIGSSLGYESLDLLLVCAWWHDVGRLYNPDHEKLSAKLMCRDLRRRGVRPRTLLRAYKAVYRHRWDMEPGSIEGKIIWDADKLDFLSTERWRRRVATQDLAHNQQTLQLLPIVRHKLHFTVSQHLFDKRLETFAEELERTTYSSLAALPQTVERQPITRVRLQWLALTR